MNAKRKEVEEKSGQMNKHDGEYQSWSNNPGSLKINGEKLRFKVPRLKDKLSGKVETSESYNRSKKKLKITKEMVKKYLTLLARRDIKKWLNN